MHKFKDWMDNGSSLSRLRESGKNKAKRSAYSYEAQNIQGDIVFRGCHSSATKSTYGALLEALVEAVVLAKRYGFSQILILSCSKRLVQQFNRDSSPILQEKTFSADMFSLKQLGLVFKYFFVPSFVINNVYNIATLATSSPMLYS